MENTAVKINKKNIHLKHSKHLQLEKLLRVHVMVVISIDRVHVATWVLGVQQEKELLLLAMTTQVFEHHYKARLVNFSPHFHSVYIVEELILQTIYVVKKENLRFLGLKSAVYNWEQFQIKSGLLWWLFGMYIILVLITSVS